MTAKDIIEKLQLQSHPEGGHYKETYRANYQLTVETGDVRNVCTAIYFLLHDQVKSNFHRIQSDELWFFHQGEPLEINYIQDDKLKIIILGNNLQNEEMLQAMIPANTWFASKVHKEAGFSLVSCTVSPGFDFNDFELGKREELLLQYPAFESSIREFTR